MRSRDVFWRAFWSSDQGLTTLLAFLVVQIFLLDPLLDVWELPRVLTEILFSLILVSGVTAIAPGRAVTIAVAAFAVLELSLDWAGRLTGSAALAISATAGGVAYFVVLASLVLRQVLAEGKVTRHRVQGAIAAYLMLGMAWAYAYALLLLADPGALRFSSTEPRGDSRLETVFYFSFITLTTLGYGDVVPVSLAARRLAMLEGLTGQLFPAILLARLVALQVEHSRSRARPESRG